MKVKKKAGKPSAKSATAPSAKAVGVVSYSPNVFVVFGAYSSQPDVDEIFAFPGQDGKDFSIPKSDGKSYVMVLDPDRLAELAPHADRIHRLLVFGDPSKVEGLGLPVIDAVVKNGKVVEQLTHRVSELREKIETKAVDLPLVPPQPKKAKKDSQAVHDSSLLARLRQLKKEFSGDKVEFENTVMIPTMLRLVREVSKAEFRKTCRHLTKYGVPTKIANQFHDYIAEQAGSGNTLGRAARSYLWPKKRSKKSSVEAAAKKYACEIHDLRLVVLSVGRLLENFVA